MAYTNSSLVTYTKISPNRTIGRSHVIDTISIHCMAGNLTVEKCGEVFAPTSRKASSNYGIGSDGRIGMYVEERDRSWCTSSAANDHRAVTIEVANDGGAPDWHVSDAAMQSLIKLCADICKRNGIKELKWKADKSLIGQVDKQNMTVHRWFAAKSCPGNYLYNKHGYIADEVNKILNPVATIPAPTPQPTQPTTTAPLKITSSIKEIQNWLNKYYSAGLTVDGIYGTNTKKALAKAFQKEVGGLIVDGIFGTNSQKAAEKVVLQSGSRGIFVTIWQAALVCNKYNPNGIDGIFGSGCVTATKSYQTNKALSQKDGVVDRATWTKMLA